MKLKPATYDRPENWHLRITGMATRDRYKVVGNKRKGYAVVLQNNAVEYDLLETRTLALAIRDVLNAGLGPNWDAVSAELTRRGVNFSGTSIRNTIS